MKKLREATKKYLIKIISDLHSAVVGSIVAGIVLGVSAGNIYPFSKKLWTVLKTTFLTPTPLWSTAALAIVVLIYFFIIKAKNRQDIFTSNQNINSSK
jgi:hypothetical protein